jgi:hypothetical protein
VKITRPCDKLDYQRLGLHPMFHCSLLEPCISSTIPDHFRPHPPPVELLNGPKYEVAAILDSKFSHGKLYYLVDWLEYGPNDQTWEPTNHLFNNAQDLVHVLSNWLEYGPNDQTWEPTNHLLSNAQDLVHVFHQYPNKPSPRQPPIPTLSARRPRRGMVS